jgi:hypothetical protein
MQEYVKAKMEERRERHRLKQQKEWEERLHPKEIF